MTKVRALAEYASNRLAEIYEERSINSMRWFILPNKEAIHVDIVTSDLLVIEFADNEEKAKIYMATTFDIQLPHYIGDYATPDELFIAMMKEIEYELKTS